MFSAQQEIILDRVEVIQYLKDTIFCKDISMPQIFKHFCPVARAVEKIGDRWSLLIIRDLLPGPQRFTDLLGCLSNITPKWLTRRLRDLEAAGIVQRDKAAGRREIRYCLTPAGRDLKPVVEALMIWGLRYAMRPPLPGECINTDLMMRGLTTSLNRRDCRPREETRWEMQFPGGAYELIYNGEEWSVRKGNQTGADVHLAVTPEDWANLMTVSRAERQRLAEQLLIKGGSEKVKEFFAFLGFDAKEISKQNR